jgi:hypothetical protein
MNLKAILFVIFILFSHHFYAQNQDAISISQDMMTSMKMNQPFDDLEKQLAEISFETLNNTLNSDLKKQAFWVNVYIVYSQKVIFDNGSCEKSCKKKKMITVGNRVFSLNDILYKILLQSKCKLSGMKKLHAPKWEKSLRVSYPDGRVLLAIDSHEKIANAVTYFEPSEMDSQLNEVGMIFLQSFVYYDVAKNEVYIPKWLKHFKREFGKSTGMIAGLKRAEVIPENIEETKIIFSDKIATFK